MPSGCACRGSCATGFDGMEMEEPGGKSNLSDDARGDRARPTAPSRRRDGCDAPQLAEPCISEHASVCGFEGLGIALPPPADGRSRPRQLGGNWHMFQVLLPVERHGRRARCGDEGDCATPASAPACTIRPSTSLPTIGGSVGEKACCPHAEQRRPLDPDAAALSRHGRCGRRTRLPPSRRHLPSASRHDDARHLHRDPRLQRGRRPAGPVRAPLSGDGRDSASPGR